MLRLSLPMLEKLNLKTGRDVVLSFGSKQTIVEVSEHSAGDNNFSADPLILGQTCLRGVNQPLAFFFDEKENNLKIGPIVAVLNSVPVMFLKPQIISLYQTITMTARQSGMLFYVFTPDLVDFAKRTVNGFQYRSGFHSNRDWVLQELPLPDIIFNQVGSISKELLPVYRKLLEEYLKEHAFVKLINPLALYDKLLIHNTLCDDQLVKHFLPETRHLNSTADLLALLEKYGAVYLKPTVSSLGRGIYKLSLHEDGAKCFILQSHQQGGEKIAEIIYGKDDLNAKLQSIISQHAYLVQQCIDLISYENRPVDFRLHLFKNALGCWDCLFIKARLGSVGGVVTGLSWGGFFLQGENMLEHVFSRNDAIQLLGELKTAAVTLAHALERLHGLEFGELGLDLGVSRNKKVWMIEVNPKPNWKLPPGRNGKKTEKNLADHLLGYCRYKLNLNDLNVSVGMPVHLIP